MCICAHKPSLPSLALWRAAGDLLTCEIARWDPLSGKHLLVYYADDETSWEDLGLQEWEYKPRDFDYDFTQHFAAKCKKCNKLVTPGQGLGCISCKMSFHPNCVPTNSSGQDGHQQLQELLNGNKKLWTCCSCSPCEFCGLATRIEDMQVCVVTH